MCLDLKKIKTKFNMYTHTHTQPHRRAEITKPFHDLHCCLHTLFFFLFHLRYLPTHPQSATRTSTPSQCGNGWIKSLVELLFSYRSCQNRKATLLHFDRCLKTHLLSKRLTCSALSVLMLTTMTFSIFLI